MNNVLAYGLLNVLLRRAVLQLPRLNVKRYMNGSARRKLLTILAICPIRHVLVCRITNVLNSILVILIT